MGYGSDNAPGVYVDVLFLQAKQIRELKARIAELEADSQRVREFNLEIINGRLKLREKLDEVTAERDQLRTQAGAATANWQRELKENDQLREKYEHSEHCRKNLRVKNEDLRAQVGELEAQCEKAWDEWKDVSYERDQLQQRIAELEELTKYWDTRDSLKEERDQLRAELEKAKRHNKLIEETNLSYYHSNCELRTELKAAKSELADLRPKPVVKQARVYLNTPVGKGIVDATFEDGKLVSTEVIGAKS